MKKFIGLLSLALAVMLTGCSSYSLTFSEVYNQPDLTKFNTFRIVTPDEGSLPPGMTMVTYYNIAAAIREQMVDRGYTEDANSPMMVNFALTVKESLVNVPYTQTIPTGGPAPIVVAGPAPAPGPRPIVPDHPLMENGGPGPAIMPGVTRRAPSVAPMPQGPAANGMVPYFIYPRSYYWPNYTTVTQWVPSLYKEGVLTIDLVDMVKSQPIYSASVATILDNGDSQLRSLSGIADAVKVLFSKFPVGVVK